MIVSLTAFLTLLVVFQVKHFVADYPLQTPYMLGKFKPGWGFVGPLAAHAGVHAVVTFDIALLFSSSLVFALEMAAFDFAVHFLMDRLKAGPKYLGRFSDKTKPEFWWCLGFDQFVHHLTHYAIIFALVTR